MRILEIDNVVKNYQGGSYLRPKKVQALKGVSLHVEKGECLAIVGESGSGKSTIGRIAIGLELPSSGHILYQGEELDARHIDRRARQALQMVYQNSYEATNPRFTARQVIEEPIRYFKLKSRAQRDAYINELLYKVGIPAIEAGKKTTEFSGGQLQRICIARALAADPELIVLDEPLSGLDISVQAQILNLLKKLKLEYGLSYLMISHDIEAVYNLSDRVMVMYNGRVVEEIDDIEKFGNMCHPYTKLLTGADLSVSGYQDKEEDTAGCVYANRCQKACVNCFKTVPELKEIEPGHKVACHQIN